MRKFFLFICLSIASLSLSAQWYGNGKTSSTAYYGVINSSNPMQTWNTTNYPPADYPGGVIYVGRSTSGQNDLVVGDGGILTIQQGITVKFCTTLSDLRITGTGILNASGTSSNGIIFTKDTEAAWGHISFEAMTTTNPENYPSVINNCLIQNGNVSSATLLPANPNQYGGAIHVDFSYVTISNCEIKNNKAGWGGAIFINSGENPAITNCYVHNNTAITSGGGIYTWKDTYSTISNCIISYNSAGAGGGGGLFIGREAKNVNIINSIISNNNASSSYGHNIRFQINTNTPKPKFINSIIWYPSNSIVYMDGGGASVTDFEYCAIQTPPIAYTNCISLNASNTDPMGPNFITTDGTNWSIQGWSPCIDIGIDHASNPDVPLTDYIGNLRVGPTDAGAYESQFYRWQGDDATNPTVWNVAGNWNSNSVPSGTQDVYIPRSLANYPISSSSQDYSIGSTKSMILAPGAKATFGTLANNGTLKLESDANNIASLILGSYSDNGNEQIELYLSGGSIPDDKWHYVSSPVTSLPVSTFAPTPTINFAQYIEARPTTDPGQGWIGYDGYIYFGGGFDSKYDIRGTNLIIGQGYNYYYTSDYKLSFTGTFNTGDVVKGITFGGDATLDGFNLLGNPFSSGLDWDYILENTSYPANTSQSLYFTRDNEQCSYVGGLGDPGDVNGIIPPMQGFFVKTYSTGNTISLTAAARTHNDIHSRYKGKGLIPLVRFSIAEDTLSHAETVIRFDEKAEPGLDNYFDAVKMFISSTKTTMYSVSEGVKYAINGQPFPVIGSSTEIPIVLNLTKNGNHTISAIQLQGLDNYKVTLTDNTSGFTADLKTTPDLTFSASAGLITDRFILKISTITPGIENPVASKNIFNIYYGYDMINIQTIADDWNGKPGSVRVMDMAGKTVTDLQNVEFSKNSLTQIQAPAVNGLYFVEIRSGLMRYVGKVVIR